MRYNPKSIVNKMRPCPYCGSKTYIFHKKAFLFIDGFISLYGVSCAKCRKHKVDGILTKQAARKHWNEEAFCIIRDRIFEHEILEVNK